MKTLQPQPPAPIHSIKAIAIYCGSSLGVNPIYAQVATEVGQGLAEKGITLIYGGGRAGLMGQIANAALSSGGQVVGVITERLLIKEAAHMGLTELVVVSDMHIRKAIMMQRADGFMTLPGGLGTFEELFEVWTWLQLGYHRKPVGLLNIHGYYDPLLTMMQHTVTQGFLRTENNAQMLVDTSLNGLLQQMQTFTPMDSDAWLRNKY